MAVVNVTGAQATTTTWNIVADEYHITGNVTINAGVVITVSGGVGQNPIRFDGNFNITSTTSGRIVSNGTSSLRIRWQPNGASTTWSGTNTSVYVRHQGTGQATFDFNDFYHVGFRDDHTANNSSVTNLRVYYGASTNLNLALLPSGGTNTYQNIEAWGCLDSIQLSPSGGTNLFDKIYSNGCSLGVACSPTGGVNTVSNVKVVRSLASGFVLGGSNAPTFSNILLHRTDVGFTGQSTAAATTFTRLVVQGDGITGVTTTPGAGKTHTFSEAYVSINGIGVAMTNSGAVADAVVSGSVVASQNRVGTIASDGILAMTSSGNDIVYLTAIGTRGAVRNGTSDNDYMAGTNGAFAGAVPFPVPGPTSDWNDPNFLINVDGDSGNTTSTSSPIQYRTLTANRTNPILTPHKPTTISGLAVSSITDGGATFDFTTGIKAKSRILLSETSGITQLNATVAGPWKYGGFLDPDDPVDFTLPVTTHQHVLSDLAYNTTYYYRVECVDPCGRHFLSTESSFTTSAVSSGAPIGLQTGGRL